MTTTDQDAKFLLRAKKLMALAHDGGATEAEAQAAALKLQELLQERGLTLAQVESAEETTAAKREKKTLDRRAMYDYQQRLMSALADNNFCLHQVASRVFVKDRGWGAATRPVRDANGQLVRDERGNVEYETGHYEKRHLLVGRSLNVEVTVQTYDYVLEALRRANPYEQRTRDGKRFLDGAVSRIVERLAAKRAEREAESKAAPARANGTGRELILSDVYGTEAELNNDALNGFPPGTTAAENREYRERCRRQREEHDRLVADGVDSTIAWYRAYGYGEEEAVKMAGSFAKSSRRRGGRGRSQSWTRGDEAHYRKVNSEAYKAGRRTGDRVGLDSQVGATSRRSLPRE